MQGWRRQSVLMVLGLALAGTAALAAPVRMETFGAANCPHCAEQQPFLDQLKQRYPDLEILRYDLWQDRVAMERLSELSQRLGTGMISTPATVVGGRIWFGHDEAIAAEVEGRVRLCLVVGCPDPRLAPAAAEGAAAPLRLPLLGEVDPQHLSLPLLTLVLGLVDSINPCAFFVLLFLLSLMVHARSRGRMFLVGGIFVLVSGGIYFLFMAAWLNLYRLAGELSWLTPGAGMLALLVAALNIKDFYRPGQGPSLSLGENSRSRLFARMRKVLATGHLPVLVLSTATLAVVANSYELLCTAGFPMVYTRVLTLHELPTAAYYGYLAAYNVVYVLPLLAIVAAFAWTLGQRKLTGREGRLLKLLSGMLMLALGLTLLLRPGLLSDPLTALLLPLAALGVSALLYHLAPSRIGKDS
jgi:hypothetical protein